MPNTPSSRLIANIPKIMDLWVHRADDEIKAAHLQETLALKNSLPQYLFQLGAALSTKIDRTEARKRNDKKESTRIGKQHGLERALSINYTIDQLILEYHILRQVICDVLEEVAPLTSIEREVIACSIEQAVNDAATEFSESMKDQQEEISNTLAHDLLNPVTAAKTSAESIMKWPEDKANCVESATRISVNMDRIKKLIGYILDTSRIKSGEGLPLEFKNCDLDWIVKDVVKESNISFGDRFIVHSSGSCLGLWDGDGLRRLIENLTTNAIKYGSNNTPIIISLEQDDHFATLKVHNKGDPIPAKELSELFQLFKRSTSVEKKIGWGFGLNMVKGMVEAHNGTIVVESDKDIGTTFIINLPKARTESGLSLQTRLSL